MLYDVSTPEKYSIYITPDMSTVVWYHGMFHTMQPGVWSLQVLAGLRLRL